MAQGGTKVVIWGATGLMGASLGMALTAGDRHCVTGLGRNPERLEELKTRGMVQDISADPAEALKDAAVLVLCAPVQNIIDQGPELMAQAPDGCLVTDVGSTKGDIVRALTPAAGQRLQFVGAHPMAGSERTGLEAARANLYEGATVALTPTHQTPAGAVAAAKTFWEGVGGRTLVMSPGEHDEGVAYVSHLPHLVASVLVLAGLKGPEVARQLAATGFLHTTRLASGSPPLWRQIVASNRQAVSAALRTMGAELAALEQAVESGDDDALETLLAKARDQRGDWVHAKDR